MKRQLVVACTLALLAASPAFAVNGNIGIFADPGLASCQTTVACDGFTTLYVYGLLQGASQFGITGAEFGIKQSAPTGWSFAEIPVAGPNLTIGNAMLEVPSNVGGLNVAYPVCETGQSDAESLPGVAVLLRKLFVQRACPSGQNRLTVVAKEPPSNQFMRCPLFVLCDQAFSLYCLGSNISPVQCPFPPFNNACSKSSSGEFLLNPNPGTSCAIAVEEKTWTGIKDLYR